MTDGRGRAWLRLAAAGDFGVAALHVFIVGAGAWAYGYFGAAQLMPLVEAGSAWPAVLTLIFAAGFATLGLYALVGAGGSRRLPLTRTVLAAAAALYLLRGLLLVPGLGALAAGRLGHPPRALVFSAVALALGVCHAAGLALGWSRLAARGDGAGGGQGPPVAARQEEG